MTDSVSEDLRRSGLDPGGMDLEKLQSIRIDVEKRIAAFRQEPGFDRALPAFAIWPELSWQEDSQ